MGGKWSISGVHLRADPAKVTSAAACLTDGTGSMDNAQQRKAPRSGSAQRQCARHIVQQGNLIYCGTKFHNEWHTGFVHGPPEDVSLQGRKTGPLLGLPTWRHAGPAVRFPQKRRPQRIGLRTSRKGPPLSQLRSKGPNPRARVCALVQLTGS